MDDVFKALADPSRRRLLDSLNARDGQCLRELCAVLDIARQSVSKHLAVLEAANVVSTVWHGREKLHYLNAVPINAIAERWMDQYDQQRVRALADLTFALENTMSEPRFVYTTYIQTTPEHLWQALTEPAFTRRYWGAELESDWTVGSPIRWREEGMWDEYRDLGQVVLESEPYRRLSYSWHYVQCEHARMLGWTEEEFVQRRDERRSKVTFDIEPAGSTVKLTVVHDDFDPDSEMLKAISGGWPAILSNLKTMLETGEAVPVA